MSDISIVGVPMDLGADRRCVNMGPSALRYANLNEKLKELGHAVADLGDLDVIIPETRHFGDPRAKYLREIVDACGRLANLVLDIREGGRTPLVLGGDHSIAVGTVAGMSESFRRQGKKIGLIWFDAHADFNTPEISPSGNVHGMPMAAIMGYGAKELTHIFGFSPKVQPEYAVMVGILFFFNDAATTEIYTLSLHDALPIRITSGRRPGSTATTLAIVRRPCGVRAEEHTCELQSRFDIGCRLLLEKKNT